MGQVVIVSLLVFIYEMLKLLKRMVSLQTPCLGFMGMVVLYYYWSLMNDTGFFDTHSEFSRAFTNGFTCRICDSRTLYIHDIDFIIFHSA